MELYASIKPGSEEANKKEMSMLRGGEWGVDSRRFISTKRTDFIFIYNVHIQTLMLT